VVEQAIEDGRRQDLIIEDLAPVDEALVARDNEARPLVAPDAAPTRIATMRDRAPTGLPPSMLTRAWSKRDID